MGVCPVRVPAHPVVPGGSTASEEGRTGVVGPFVRGVDVGGRVGWGGAVRSAEWVGTWSLTRTAVGRAG